MPAVTSPLMFLSPAVMFLSPLGERLGEGVTEDSSCITPSPNLSPKGATGFTHFEAVGERGGIRRHVG
jgi:hypothetical protein